MNFLDRMIKAQEDRLAKADEEFKNAGAFRLGSFLDDHGRDFTNGAEMIDAVRKLWDSIDEFYAPAQYISAPRIDKDVIQFDSAVENGTGCLHARFVGWESARKRAVIIIPHWGAKDAAYASAARALSWFGFAVFLITLPHHGGRAEQPPDPAANAFLNANLGAAIRSVRQSVSDVRSLVGLLYDKGFEEVNLVGVSLGSCVGGLCAAVDRRITRSALLLTAGDFAETVWTGRATAHIRAAIEPNIGLEELQQLWSVISPIEFMEQYRANQSRMLIISGKRDEVVLPNLTSAFVKALESARIEVVWRVLPCGHYTLGTLPYSAISLWMIGRCLRN